MRMSLGETGSGKNKTVAIVRDNSRSIIRWVLFLSSSGPGPVQVRVKKVRVRVKSSSENCQWWFRLKFKGDYKKHFSQPTAKSSKLKSHSKFI